MGEFEVGQLAQDLYIGYMAYAGTLDVLADAAASSLIATIEANNPGPAPVPTGRIFRMDASEIVYDLSNAIRRIQTTTAYQHTYARLWLGGALLSLGDQIEAEGGFDRGPDLELVRHLRNGVAHGNRFKLSPKEPTRPARFTGLDRRFRAGTETPAGDVITFEITRQLNGQLVLFDFMGPGDICDLLQFISVRLMRIANGDPPQALWPQKP